MSKDDETPEDMLADALIEDFMDSMTIDELRAMLASRSTTDEQRDRLQRFDRGVAFYRNAGAPNGETMGGMRLWSMQDPGSQN